ncbi:methionine synthase [Pseudoscourfieldia marina]
MVEDNNYAVDFINATREIKRVCPGCKISGGVSNIAFSFRGNEPVRLAFHSDFLHHACEAGVDVGIVNAAQVIEDKYENIDKELLKYVDYNQKKTRHTRSNDVAITAPRSATLQGAEKGVSVLADEAGGEVARLRRLRRLLHSGRSTTYEIRGGRNIVAEEIKFIAKFA